MNFPLYTIFIKCERLLGNIKNEKYLHQFRSNITNVSVIISQLAKIEVPLYL